MALEKQEFLIAVKGEFPGLLWRKTDYFRLCAERLFHGYSCLRLVNNDVVRDKEVRLSYPQLYGHVYPDNDVFRSKRILVTYDVYPLNTVVVRD